MKRLFWLLLFTPFSVLAQDASYVKSIIDTLSAPRYDGRGYVNHGDIRAADFLARECASLGLTPIGNSYFQAFELGVNSFPGAMDVTLNGQRLEPGKDFIIAPRSIGQKGEFKAFHIKKKHTKTNTKLFKLAEKEKVNASVVVVDQSIEDVTYQSFIARINENPLRAKGYILLNNDKLTWSVGRSMLSSTLLHVSKDSVDRKIKKVALDIDQQWQAEYSTKNVAAQLLPKAEWTKTIVFTAHYDHLGRMGADTYIPGASDNASGSAMLLDLAQHYLENRPNFRVVFIWFAAEEAGLVGSKYFVDHPMIELEDIDFLINLDLMADAKKGITVVNGKIFDKAFDQLAGINDNATLLNQVKARGAAANSDHYPFYEKGVPSFFIYTVGDYKHYHDVNDKAENVPLTNYDNVFQLITEFAERVKKDY